MTWKDRDRLELILPATRCQGFHVSFAHGMTNNAFEFHDKLRLLEDEVCLKSIKRMISNDLDSPNESHHLDRVNFSTLNQLKTTT